MNKDLYFILFFTLSHCAETEDSQKEETMKVTGTLLLLLASLIAQCIQALQLLHGIRSFPPPQSVHEINRRADPNSAVGQAGQSVGQFGQFRPNGQNTAGPVRQLQRFQVYGQSVINVDGMLEKSLAAVIRVPRSEQQRQVQQPFSNEMPNDEPDTTSPSGKNHCNTIQ